jgi:hypothetical protein
MAALFGVLKDLENVQGGDSTRDLSVQTTIVP